MTTNSFKIHYVWKSHTFSMARSLADRALGFKMVSCSLVSMGLSVIILPFPDSSNSLKVFLTIRSSKEWKLITTKAQLKGIHSGIEQ